MSQSALFLRVAVLTILYVATAKLGIELSVAQGVITPVWIPTGLSLAALLLFGYRLWPGVALGAFIANATSDLPLVLAAGISVGNTLEAVVGTYLLRRVGFQNSLERVRDVLALVALGALLSTAIAASVGVGVLWLGGEIESVGNPWVLWWFGDAVGAILVAPVLLTWISVRKSFTSRSAVEAIVLAAALVSAGCVVFLGGSWRYPYLLFPLMVWAAIRFRQLGASAALFLVGAIGTIGTVQGAVPIGAATPTDSVQILQALIVVVGVAVLTMAGTLSELDHAQRELQTAHEHLASAQALAHVGSWEWDIPRNRVIWSDEMYRIYGYEPRSFEVTFEKAMERVVPEDREKVTANLQSEFGSGRDHVVPDIHYRIRRSDGSERNLVGKGSMRFSENNEPLVMVGTVEDVTDSYRASQELAESLRRERETAERLRELNQIKNTFMSAVSHDLRTPLTTIGGLAEILMRRFDGLDRSTIMESLGRIEANARRSTNVLQNLLDVDRVSRGAVEPVRRHIDLADLVAKVAVGFDPDERPNLELPRQQVTVAIDEGLVERVVANLLTNAVRHTPAGTPVLVRIIEQDDGAVLCVEDRGPGVPDHMKEKIFEPFERGSEGNVTGSGVGLFLVAEFAGMHGGRAWVEDAREGGASFRVFFPQAGSDVAATGPAGAG